MSSYTPINCDFYDHFEIHAMRKDWVRITLKNGESLISMIVDMETKNKEEFALLLDNQKLRLDEVEQLIHLDPYSSGIGLLLDKVTYNQWANHRVKRLIMSDRKPNNEVIRLMSHVYNAITIWNSRMLQTTSTFDVWQVHPIENWQSIHEKCLIDTVNVLNMHSIDHLYHYKDTEGNPYASKIASTIFHMVNHSTYHRGQIIQKIQQLGKPTTSTDYFIYKLGLSD